VVVVNISRLKIVVVLVGKTVSGYLKDGIEEFLTRLTHYISVEVIQVDPSVFTGVAKQKAVNEESSRILKNVEGRDFVVLLDETGRSFSSIELSELIDKQRNSSTRKMIFIIGGAYGVNDLVKQRANIVMSFSKFTFTHQMIRLLLLEQLYRAMTILKNESYHH
jgi:23S rRNA (pseudouridine1915-N3)-methyltransferase